MEKEWVMEDRNRDMWSIVNDVSRVEEIPISSIVSLAEDHGLPCQDFVEKWEALLDASHELINRAEDLM
jgi:hypothetical protein